MTTKTIAPPASAESEVAEPSAVAASEAIQVPISAIGETPDGGTVSFTVVSRDEASGMATVEAAAEAPEAPEASGTDGMAEEFNKPQEA